MAIRQRMYPTQDQKDVLALHCAHAGFVWNLALEQASLFSQDKADRGVRPNGARAKAALNRAILASVWGVFATRLGHKTDTDYADPRNTSRQCNQCGHTDAGNRQSQAVFTCTDCGHSAHADTNAARSIADRALTTWSGPPPASTGATRVCGRAGRERTHQPHPATGVPRQPQPVFT